jgi:hypothetical protein
MKIKIHLLRATLLLSAFCFPLSAFSQGSLTPPGAPAPTMKTLDQIEPRMPISSAPFTINVPGSYYLTTNLTVSSGNGITIVASDVTLDLSGFTISSTDPANSGRGIMSSGARINLAIYNGHISGGVTNKAGTYGGNGFSDCIYTGSSRNVRVSGVSVSGCLGNGIYLGEGSTVVQSCVADTAGGYGISAHSVSDSTALNCGNYGIDAFDANNCYGESEVGGAGVGASTASNCRGYNYSNGDGVGADTALNCEGASSSGNGVSAGTAQNCYGTSNSGNGVNATSAQNCYGTSTSGSGVNATSAINCYGLSYGNGDGLDAAAAQNCWGTSYGSGTGVSANTANNCTANSNTGTGLYAARTAAGCDGESIGGTGLYVYTGVAVGSFGHSSTGLGLKAYVANGCYGQNGSGSSEFTGNTGSDQRYNMP